jgi:hypothetical protein
LAGGLAHLRASTQTALWAYAADGSGRISCHERKLKTTVPLHQLLRMLGHSNQWIDDIGVRTRLQTGRPIMQGSIPDRRQTFSVLQSFQSQPTAHLISYSVRAWGHYIAGKKSGRCVNLITEYNYIYCRGEKCKKLYFQ